MKFALISNVLPPSETAHAMIIHRLLRDLDPGSYCLLSSKDYGAGGGPEYVGRLAAKYYHLPPPFRLTRGYRFGLEFVRERVNLALAVALRARQIARVLRREGCGAAVVCTGGNEVLDFPSGYLASLLTGARFYAYLLDQYAHMVSYVMGGGLLRRFEAPILKGAAAVIAPNEFLSDELRRRYRVEAVVIRNACDLSLYEALPGGPAAAGAGGEGRIVYTGGGGAGPL